MIYSIQKKLHSLLENLQAKLDKGFFDSDAGLKSEATDIVTKIKNEYQNEILEFAERTAMIREGRFNIKNFLDQSFMEYYFEYNLKKNVEKVVLSIEFIAKCYFADEGLNIQQEIIHYIKYCLRKIKNQEIYFELKSRIIKSFDQCMFHKFSVEEQNGIDNHNLKFNHEIVRLQFMNYLVEEISFDPRLLQYFFSDNSHLYLHYHETDHSNILLNLILKNVELIKFIPQEKKNNLLISLFVLEQGNEFAQYLHPSYRDNNQFCKLFKKV